MLVLLVTLAIVLPMVKPQFTTLGQGFIYLCRDLWLLILVLQAYTVTSYACHPDFYDIYALLALPVVTTKPISISSESLNKLHPYWVTGFTDAEGCFQIRIRENKRKSGWVFELRHGLKNLYGYKKKI